MREWTEDEDIYLEYYLFDDEEKTYDSAAYFLNRTNRDLVMRARKLRTENNDVRYMRRPFTRKEIDYIKENHLKQSLKWISKKLDRSEEVVSWKACQLGLQKIKKLKNYDSEIRQLAKEGKTVPEITRTLGLKYSSVREYTIRNNIVCKKAPRRRQTPPTIFFKNK